MKVTKALISSCLPISLIERLKHHDRFNIEVYPEYLSGNDLITCLQGKDAIVSTLTQQITATVLSQCPDLKLIGNVAVGYDNIDVTAATDCGALVLNTPGVLDNATADLAFALLMTCARRIVESDGFVRAGKWSRWSFNLMLGSQVSGKTLGIVGLGRIGQALAKRACAFDMRILYTGRRRLDSEIESRFQAQYVSLDELLTGSDFISLHCPLNQQTHHLIGARELSVVQPHCILINTGRGPLIDEQALVKALKESRLAGAGLDVFEQEPIVSEDLLSMPNVVLTPHIGSATVETRAAMANLAVDGMISAFAGTMPPNVVNPDVWPRFCKRAL